MASYKFRERGRAVSLALAAGMFAVSKLSSFVRLARQFGRMLISKLSDIFLPIRNWPVPFFKFSISLVQSLARKDEVRSFFVFMRLKNGWTLA